MGYKIRKSKTIAPGVRVSTTGKSASVSFGGKAGRVTVNSSGRVTKTARIPGTNVSYVSSSGGRRVTEHSSSKPRAKVYGNTKLTYISPEDFAEMSTPDFLAYSNAFLSAAETVKPETGKEFDRATAQVNAINAEAERRMTQKQAAAGMQMPAEQNSNLAKFSDNYLRSLKILMVVLGVLFFVISLPIFAYAGLLGLVFIAIGMLCFAAAFTYGKEVKRRHVSDDK